MMLCCYCCVSVKHHPLWIAHVEDESGQSVAVRQKSALPVYSMLDTWPHSDNNGSLGTAETYFPIPEYGVTLSGPVTRIAAVNDQSEVQDNRGPMAAMTSDEPLRQSA